MVCFCWVIYVPTQAILSARFPMYAMYASLISLPPLFHLLVSLLGWTSSLGGGYGRLTTPLSAEDA